MSVFTTTAKSSFSNASASTSATALISGTLDILDSSNNVLSSHSLGTPSASGAVTTMGGFPKSISASATGVAATARYRTLGGTDWVTGVTVGTSGTEVILSSTSITSGQTVTINSATLTHTAS